MKYVFGGAVSCAQQTSAASIRSDAVGTAVPTFVGAATDVIAEFFNSKMTAQEAVVLLADGIELAK